jgi:hypothetical protein
MGWSGRVRSQITTAQEESTAPRDMVGFGRQWMCALLRGAGVSHLVGKRARGAGWDMNVWADRRIKQDA